MDQQATTTVLDVYYRTCKRMSDLKVKGEEENDAQAAFAAGELAGVIADLEQTQVVKDQLASEVSPAPVEPTPAEPEAEMPDTPTA